MTLYDIINCDSPQLDQLTPCDAHDEEIEKFHRDL